MHYVKAKSLLSQHNGMNVYRGCSHGCIYCDSRSLCYGMNHRFEDIEVKINAPELLEDALRRKRARCMIGTGSMCDPYMHCEEKLELTRKCLSVTEKYGFGATLITKSDRVKRDIDLLRTINGQSKCVVQMTLTTYDEALCRIVEPNVCTTSARTETLAMLRDNGIPTVVWLSPLLPFINDTEENLRGILRCCFETGVKGILCFGMGLTLRDGNREYFYRQLDSFFPGLRERYQKKYGYAYEIMSDNSDRLYSVYLSECQKHRVMSDTGEIFGYLHEFTDEDAGQTRLF